MRLFYLFFLLFFLFGCTGTPKPVSATQTETTKIVANFTEAQIARNEYTALQDQRIKEK